MITLYKIISKAKVAKYYVLALMCGVYASCTEDKEYNVANEGNIYMSQARPVKSELTMYDIDTIQDIYFGASYGGLNYPSADIPVKFEIDVSLVDAYNQQHGTDFQVFPSSSYTVSALESVILKGQLNSIPLNIAVKARELQIGKGYMLPVKLVSAGHAEINSDLSVAYFRMDSLIRRARDITNLASLSVSHENYDGQNANEGSLKLIDGDLSSKYLTFDYTPGMWFQLKFPSPKVIGAYSFTSGNDAHGRDPKDWRLEGSNDGISWDVLDSRKDHIFTDFNQTVTFEFNNNTAYTFYRVVIESNNGESLFQMSEWRLTEFY